MSSCCTTAAAPQNNLLWHPADIWGRVVAQLHSRSKCKGCAVESRQYFQNNQNQRSFHVIIEISFRGLLLWSVLLEEKLLVKFLYLWHLQTLVCTSREYLNQFTPCLQAVVDLTIPCWCLTLDREAINDNSCYFQERTNPGGFTAHMRSSLWPPAFAIVRVRSVGACRSWIRLHLKLKLEKEISTWL